MSRTDSPIPHLIPFSILETPLRKSSNCPYSKAHSLNIRQQHIPPVTRHTRLSAASHPGFPGIRTAACTAERIAVETSYFLFAQQITPPNKNSFMHQKARLNTMCLRILPLMQTEYTNSAYTLQETLLSPGLCRKVPNIIVIEYSLFHLHFLPESVPLFHPVPLSAALPGMPPGRGWFYEHFLP